MRAGQGYPRGMLVREEEEPLLHPRRHVVERVLVRELDPFALQPLVEIDTSTYFAPRSYAVRATLRVSSSLPM